MTTYTRRWLMCLVVAIITFASTEGPASPARAQSPDHGGVVTMTPEKFHSEVQASRAELARYLSSSQGRPDLVIKVQAFLGERIMMAPAGDERQNEFPQRLSETFKLFTFALDKLGPEQISNLDLVEFEASSLDAYNHNMSQFAYFVSKSYVFSKVDPVKILRTALEFSMTLYAFDRDRWRAVQHMTHVWPLCWSFKSGG